MTLALLAFDLYYLLLFHVSSVGTVDIIMTFKDTVFDNLPHSECTVCIRKYKLNVNLCC